MHLGTTWDNWYFAGLPGSRKSRRFCSSGYVSVTCRRVSCLTDLDRTKIARVGASPIRRRDHSPMLFSSRLFAQALNRRALRINQTTATTMTTLNKAKKSSLDSCISESLIEYPTSKHAGSPIQSSLGCGVSGNPGVALLSASKKTACWLVKPSALSGRRIVLKMRRAQPDTAVYL